MDNTNGQVTLNLSASVHKLILAVAEADSDKRSFAAIVEDFAADGATARARSQKYSRDTANRKAHQDALNALYELQHAMKPEVFAAEREKVDRKFGYGGTKA